MIENRPRIQETRINFTVYGFVEEFILQIV